MGCFPPSGGLREHTNRVCGSVCRAQASAVKCINLVLQPPPREEHQEKRVEGSKSSQLSCSWHKHFQPSSRERGARLWVHRKVRLVLLVPLQQPPPTPSPCKEGAGWAADPILG